MNRTLPAVLAWLIATPAAAADTVASAFPPPEGFTRVASDPFAAWLQAQLLAPADQPVRTYDGRVVRHRARVIALPLVPGDLQQCADTVIRWRATWLRDQGLPVSFHATSGEEMPYANVRAGQVPFVRDGHIAWRPGALDWEGYLAKVFTWAGTASVARLDTRAATLAPGTLLVTAGHPGHAVQVLDVATDGARTVVLVAEGYMPAMDAHVELGPHAGWWTWSEGVDIGHWRFEAGDVRAWR